VPRLPQGGFHRATLRIQRSRGGTVHENAIHPDSLEVDLHAVALDGPKPLPDRFRPIRTRTRTEVPALAALVRDPGRETGENQSSAFERRVDSAIQTTWDRWGQIDHDAVAEETCREQKHGYEEQRKLTSHANDTDASFMVRTSLRAVLFDRPHRSR
jgi:hypothetical protein